ncbi:MAG: hypothetical protein AAF581_09710 [Planctomycetota bacterium]
MFKYYCAAALMASAAVGCICWIVVCNTPEEELDEVWVTMGGLRAPTWRETVVVQKYGEPAPSYWAGVAAMCAAYALTFVVVGRRSRAALSRSAGTGRERGRECDGRVAAASKSVNASYGAALLCLLLALSCTLTVLLPRSEMPVVFGAVPMKTMRVPLTGLRVPPGLYIDVPVYEERDRARRLLLRKPVPPTPPYVMHLAIASALFAVAFFLLGRRRSSGDSGEAIHGK